jgi:hypothetical protein
MQTRRRRITAESSVGRESFTWVSRLLQLGQRMDYSPSLPGLTRQSILFRRVMDALVKPAHDAVNLEMSADPIDFNFIDKSGNGR